MDIKRVILKVIFIFIGTTAYNSDAQIIDTLSVHHHHRDTLNIYKKIRRSAYKHKFTRYLYQAVFIDPAPLSYEKKPLSNEQKIKDPNQIYEGKVIRSIKIIVLDPFGFSANDTFRSGINTLQKFGNAVHIVSHKSVIRNRLLFKKTDKVDLLKMRESERLIRATPYVNDAKIYLYQSKSSVDSIDVVILVQDRWTIDPTIGIKQTGANLRLRDKNLLGLGHTFEQNFKYDKNSGMEYRGNYFISNIRNTFISSNLYYLANKTENSIGLQLDRPFYSVLTNFAGGASYLQTWAVFPGGDSITPNPKIVRSNMDHWIAAGFPLPGGNRYNRPGARFVSAFRYANARFQERPPFELDTLKLNTSNTLYLISTGISYRKYYKDQYIYRFGANEDVPEGTLFQVLYGYYHKEITGWWNYLGFEISEGKHIQRFGYLSGNIQYGTLLKYGKKDNATLSAGFDFFSNLSLERKWYIRQFVSGRYLRGFNKPSTERITLHTDELFGFSSGSLNGFAKMFVNFTTVMYAPYNLIGFKFAPVALLGFGMLQNSSQPILKGKIYQSYAAGLLIRNESLLNSSFEITFGMYPNSPDHRNPVFKLNPITSFTLKLTGFAISKPTMVGFN